MLKKLKEVQMLLFQTSREIMFYFQHFIQVCFYFLGKKTRGVGAPLATALIKGEAIRRLRTDSSENDFQEAMRNFKT